MSDLLEQAIIDAAALKEAAIKNAENALVEKYSQEFKQTVEKLLEQETADSTPDMSAASLPTDPAADATPETADPMAVDAAGATSDLSAAPVKGEEDKKDAFSSVKAAFLDGPDDELITIKFDQLRETMMEMFGHKEEVIEEDYDRTGTRTEDFAPDALSAPAPNLEEEDQLELELEEDLEEEYEQELDEEIVDEMGLASSEGEERGIYLDEEEDPQLLSLRKQLADAESNKAKLGAANDKTIADLKIRIADYQSDMANKPTPEKTTEPKAATSPTVTEEEIELSEEELMELEEQLRVDLNAEHQGRGYMGSTTTEKELGRNVNFAAMRDEKEVEKREEEEERLKDLVDENKKLKALNNKMVSLFESLKGEVEKINVSNAKLLYTNKALGNVSLNERQKNAIVESISKAGSVLEAKTIYETLQNAVENAEIKQEAPQTLRETLNRAQSPFVVKKSATNSINDVMAARLKALAGINNK